MNRINRARISIVRQPIRTFILFTLFILLGSATAGAVSVNRAIEATAVNLTRQTPAIATVIQDNDSFFEYIEFHDRYPDHESRLLTSEIIESIGNLPYVRAFDYALISQEFYSRELVLPHDLTLYASVGIESVIIWQMLNQFSLGMDRFEHFRLKGIHNPIVLDIEEGAIELVSGRVFTEDEIQLARPVTLISQAFADANNLHVGATFTLEQNLYNWGDSTGELSDIFQDDNLILSEIVELEVIGIFTPSAIMDEYTNETDLMNHMDFNHLLYVPMGIVKLPTLLWLDYLQENAPEQLDEFGLFDYEHVIFVLYDPLDLGQFNEAASALLPEFWLMNDLTRAFRDITISMNALSQVAHWTLVGASMASVLILGLVITLFLRDRKQEMGIYLALGEKKRNIIFQMLIELLAILSISMVIALFIGNTMANHLSLTMLRNEMASNMTPIDMGMVTGINDFNQMGFGFWMTHEQMLDAYTFTLDASVVATFIIASLMIVLLSTILPIIYLSKLNLKNILEKASIG